MVRVQASLLGIIIALLSQSLFAAVVLFDQGHGQRFVIEREGDLELSRFADALRSEGHDVSSTDQRLTRTQLAKADLLVISGAFAPYMEDEQRAILAFLREGGALLLTVHVGPLNGPLLAALGIAVTNGVLLEEARLLEHKPSDFVALRDQPHPLNRQLDDFRVYGAWGLRGSEGMSSIWRSGERSWVDLVRNRQFDEGEPRASFSLAIADARPGHRLLVVGDDAVFQNRFFFGDNAVFAERVVTWLTKR